MYTCQFSYRTPISIFLSAHLSPIPRRGKRCYFTRIFLNRIVVFHINNGKDLEQGLVLGLINLREFHTTHAKMTSTFVHS